MSEVKERRPRTPAQLANDERLRSRAKDAQNNPAVIRKMVETAEQPIVQEGTREFVGETLNKIGFQTGKRERSPRWHEDMAFANEMVRVRVHQDKDTNCNPFPEVWVNGRVQRFVRGEEITVRRCYVERLARMKKTGYDSVKTKDVNGEDVYRYPSRTALEYDFTVIGDSAKGEAWLRNILLES